MHNNAHSLFYLLHFALIIVATFHCVSCSTGSSCTLIMLARPVPPVSRAGTDSRKLPQGHAGDFVVAHSDLIMLAYSLKGRKGVGKGEKWCSLRRNKKKSQILTKVTGEEEGRKEVGNVPPLLPGSITNQRSSFLKASHRLHIHRKMPHL